MEAVHDKDGALIGVRINMTTISEEAITLMGSEIAKQRKEIEKLTANCELRGAVINDLQIQMRGLMMLVTDPAWARRWKAAAKKWYRAYKEDV